MRNDKYDKYHKMKIQQTSEYNIKNHIHKYRQHLSVVASGGGNIGVRGWEVQTIRCKTGSRIINHTTWGM